jgi:hypothetical protein
MAMGFSAGPMMQITKLGQGGHIPRGARFLDYGSQNISGDFPAAATKDFLRTFADAGRYHADLTADGAKIDRLLQAAGFDYTAIDTYSAGSTVKFDLNLDRLPDAWHGAFDVVANLGTTEHVCNQFNAFQCAHDALKVGGVMLNFVPFHGLVNHGLFNYHPKFFTMLIHNNGYLPLFWSFSDIFEGPTEQDNYLALSQAANGAAWEGKYVGSALMMIIFKKQHDAAFQPPTDAVLEGDVIVPFPTVDRCLATAPLANAPAAARSFVGNEI